MQFQVEIKNHPQLKFHQDIPKVSILSEPSVGSMIATPIDATTGILMLHKPKRANQLRISRKTVEYRHFILDGAKNSVKL